MVTKTQAPKCGTAPPLLPLLERELLEFALPCRVMVIIVAHDRPMELQSLRCAEGGTARLDSCNCDYYAGFVVLS